MKILTRLVLLLSILFVCLALVIGSTNLLSLLFSRYVPYHDAVFQPNSFGLVPGSSVAWRGNHGIPLFWVVGPAFLFCVLLCLGLLAWQFVKGGTSRNHETIDKEETRIMQEIYHGLSKLEDRVESLETILLEHSQKIVTGRELD